MDLYRSCGGLLLSDILNPFRYFLFVFVWPCLFSFSCQVCPCVLESRKRNWRTGLRRAGRSGQWEPVLPRCQVPVLPPPAMLWSVLPAAQPVISCSAPNHVNTGPAYQAAVRVLGQEACTARIGPRMLQAILQIFADLTFDFFSSLYSTLYFSSKYKRSFG